MKNNVRVPVCAIVVVVLLLAACIGYIISQKQVLAELKTDFYQQAKDIGSLNQQIKYMNQDIASLTDEVSYLELTSVDSFEVGDVVEDKIYNVISNVFDLLKANTEITTSYSVFTWYTWEWDSTNSPLTWDWPKGSYILEKEYTTYDEVSVVKMAVPSRTSFEVGNFPGYEGKVMINVEEWHHYNVSSYWIISCPFTTETDWEENCEVILNLL